MYINIFVYIHAYSFLELVVKHLPADYSIYLFLTSVLHVRTFKLKWLCTPTGAHLLFFPVPCAQVAPSTWNDFTVWICSPHYPIQSPRLSSHGTLMKNFITFQVTCDSFLSYVPIVLPSYFFPTFVGVLCVSPQCLMKGSLRTSPLFLPFPTPSGI